MKTTHAIPVNLALLAQLMERLDRSPRGVDATQYRDLATRLTQEIEATEDAEAVQALLAASPAAAELYENRHYAHAGLCRSPLDRALAAEAAARSAIEAASKRSRGAAGAAPDANAAP